MNTSPAIAPAACLARVTSLRHEIEELRADLGRPVLPAHQAVVRGAEPRECWIAARGLLARADRLAQEGGIDGILAPVPAMALAAIRPADVLALLDATAARLAAFRAVHGGGQTARADATGATCTPSDVLVSVLEASRQLDHLLEKPTTPGDVYAEVSRGAAYARALLAHTGNEPASPTTDTTGSRRKRPADCFKTLASCLALATRASRSAGLLAMERSDAPPEDGITPADVLDVAALITGERVAAHAIAGAPHAAAAPFAQVRRRTPSDVLSLCVELQNQLTVLARAVEAAPLKKS